MRILMLARYLPQEGSSIHIYSLAKELTERGHSVAVASAGHNGSSGARRLFDNSVESGVQHIQMPFPLKPKFGPIGRILQALQYLGGMPIAVWRIVKWAPDIVHVHYPVTSFVAAIYRRLSGVRFVTTHHIAGIPLHPLHRRADGVVAISSELHDELEHVYRYTRETIFRIPNGIDVQRFGELKDSDTRALRERILPAEAQQKTVIGFVGSINPRKGLDILLQAISGLDKTLFHLVIVGDGDRQWLQDWIEKTSLDSCISVYGFADPDPYYSIMDVFVLPSRKEGFGLVAVEAMASGILTVRSDVEGARDQIIHGQTGFLFEQENYLELRDLLETVLYTGNGNGKISKAGQKYVFDTFSIGAMTDRTVDIYNQFRRPGGRR